MAVIQKNIIKFRHLSLTNY